MPGASSEPKHPEPQGVLRIPGLCPLFMPCVVVVVFSVCMCLTRFSFTFRLTYSSEQILFYLFFTWLSISRRLFHGSSWFAYLFLPFSCNHSFYMQQTGGVAVRTRHVHTALSQSLGLLFSLRRTVVLDSREPLGGIIISLQRKTEKLCGLLFPW